VKWKNENVGWYNGGWYASCPRAKPCRIALINNGLAEYKFIMAGSPYKDY
jgi:hypothetical protein